MSIAPSYKDNPMIRLSQLGESRTSENVISNVVENGNCNFPNHAKNTLKFIESCFQSQRLTDVTLVAGNKRINAHRLVLSASSDFFAAMFTSSLRESSQDEIELMEIDGDALVAIVRYSYTGCIELQEENIQTLLVTARFLQANPVVEACRNFLIKQLDPSNCLGIKKFADTLGCDELSSAANAHALDKFVEVAKNQEFLSLSAKKLTQFLKSDDVNVPSEETIFYALRTWLKHDSKNRIEHASMLLSHVRLPLIRPKFIVDHIQTDELFRDQKGVQELISEAFTYHRLQECNESLLQSGRTQPRKSTKDVLLVLGDKRVGEDFYSSIDAFFLREKIWKNLTNMTDRGNRFGAVLFENELFVVGGIFCETPTNTVQSFNFSGCSWKDMPSMDTRRHGVGVAVLEGLLYAVGGYNDKALSSVERWNPNSKKWSYVSPMLKGRCDAGVAVVNNKLYVVGGWNCRHELNTVECYDPHKNEWTSCSPMSEARDRVGVGVLNGYIYAIGGPSTSAPISSVERYDPKTDTWTTIAPMSVARSNAGVGVIGNRFFVVGGWGCDGEEVTLIEAYDPALNEWQEVASVEVGAVGPCIVVDRSICEL